MIKAINFGKPTAAQKKYFKPAQLAIENFKTEQFGFRILDLEIETNAESDRNPLFRKPKKHAQFSAFTYPIKLLILFYDIQMQF